MFLDQDFLRHYANENNIVVKTPYQGQAMIDLTGNEYLKGYFDSLLPYLDQLDNLNAKIATLKTTEAIGLLLQADKHLVQFLFDFQEPYKMDLEAYMLHHYQYNIPMASFAKFTGRSFSSFKRDFAKIFGTTPEKWLHQKLLEKAHYLISVQKMKSSKVHLEVGFENLSHF